MNQVMKILKDEEIKQSDTSFDLTCRININFRASICEKILKKFERVEGLKYLYLKTQ
jgi:hypothetical protein